MDLGQFIIQNFHEFLTYTAFANATVGNLIMIAVGAFFIWLAIKKDFEPLLPSPMGTSNSGSKSFLMASQMKKAPTAIMMRFPTVAFANAV